MVGAFLRASSRDSGSSCAFGGFGIDDFFQSQGPDQKLAQLARFDQTAEPAAFAILCAHIVLPGGQPSAVDAVAELHGRAAVIITAHNVNTLVGAAPVKKRRLLPQHIVDVHFERGSRAAGRVGADISERRLAQRKTLIRQRRIAAAEQLLDALAMGGGGDIGVDTHRGAVVNMDERARKLKRRAIAISG